MLANNVYTQCELPPLRKGSIIKLQTNVYAIIISMNNQAFIDGQNLYMNTKESNWRVDLNRLRIYLAEKYNVEKAYYFIGSQDNDNAELYELIRSAGFMLVFRPHSLDMRGNKKGNVDTDVVFTIMSKIADRESFDKVVLVSGDGDYFRMVDYLIKKNRFAKLLAPNKHSMSSLYKPFTPKYTGFLDAKGTKAKIELKPKK